MKRVGEHPVPSGPLAVRWLAYEVAPPRAGALGEARLQLENAGRAPWQDVRLGYHWLDELGNPIVWDGLRTGLRPAESGEPVEVGATVRGPIPPGRYRLAFDLVLEDRYWFAEVGNAPLELALTVAPRIDRALAAVGAEVESQDEPLVPLKEAAAVAYLAPGCVPAPDWSRRLLDAHQEGYAVVAGSIEAGRSRALAPWAPGGGRDPAFSHALLCPSIVKGVEPTWFDPVEGLPALEPPPPDGEPWMYDGRITVRLRSGRRPG